MRKTCFVTIFILLLNLATYAGDFEDGQTAFEAKDYDTAVKKWKPLAESGNAEAQASLGLMFFQGVGVPRDHAKAGEWWTKAAEQNNAQAQFRLGFMYSQGLGGYPKDRVQAYKWWDLAASKGIEEAEHYRNFIVNKMTPEEINEAKKLSKGWMEKLEQSKE